MTRTLLIVLVAAAATAGLNAQDKPFDAAQGRRGDAQRGKELFVKTGCYQCHGYEAQGASTGPRLGPEPIAFARFVAYVRKPAGEMPPYTVKVLSDAQLADIHAFVSTRQKPTARPPLLKK
jgi:mono/diheme cytochrome c family protein